MKIRGYISFYNERKKFGFIDCPEAQLNDIYFFHSDADYKNIRTGDEVLTSIGRSVDYLYSYQAYEIEFVRNLNLESLRKAFDANNQLTGFLKKINGKFYVKERITRILIPLFVSKFELDIVSQYEKKINHVIPFSLILFSDKNKLRAIRTDKIFKEDIDLLINQEIFKGQVIKKDKAGIYVKLIRLDVIGFLPNNLILKKPLKKEICISDLIDVYCLELNLERDNIILDLV